MTSLTSTDRAGKICPVHNVKHDRGNTTDRAVKQAKMVKLHGNACVYCGLAWRIPMAPMERERVQASCYYVITNLIPACHQCNQARSDTDILEWLTVCETPERACEAIRLAATSYARLDATDEFYANLKTLLENLPY